MKKIPIYFFLITLLFVPVLRSAPLPIYFQAITNLQPAGYWPLHEVEAPAQGDIETNYGTLGLLGTGYYPDWEGTPSLILRGAPGAIAGDPDTAVYFAIPIGNSGATTNSLYVPHTSPLSTLTPPFSVECWYYPSNNNQGDIWSQNGYEGLNAGASGGGAGSVCGIRLYWNGPGFNLYTYHNSSALNLLGSVSGASYAAGHWYHLVVTVDSSTNFTLSINGNSVFTKAATTLFAPDYWTPFEVGNGRGNTRAVTGIVDEVAVYTNVLADIGYHYSTGTTSGANPSYFQVVTNDNPTIYFRMDGPTYTPPAQATWPVATNYGIAGGNGLYAPGTMPGILTGPANTSGSPYTGAGNGTVALFSGVSSFVDVPYATAFDPIGLQPFSLVVWFKGNPSDNRFQTIAGHSDNSWHLAMNTNGKLQYALGTNATSVLNSVGVYNDGNWHQVIATYTPGSGPGITGTNALFVDGALDTAVTTVSTSGAGPGSSMDILIGADPQYTNNPNGVGRQFAGCVSEVALFTNSLTLSNVQALYSAAVTVLFPKVVVAPSNSAITVNAGSTLAFTSSAAGQSPLYYQWTSNNVAIPGQTNSSLTLSNISADFNGDVLALVVSNAYGSTQSPGTTLTVNSGSPQIVTDVQPLQLSLYQGLPWTYSIAVQGNFPFYYQWTENGVNIGGATASNFTVASPSGTNLFSVNVSNNYNGGSVTGGATATLVGVPLPAGSYPTAVLAGSPIAYWRLDEANGSSTANDYAGGHDGNYNQVQLGVTGYSADDADTAAAFGTNAYYYTDSYMQEINNSGEGIPLIDFAAPAGQNAEFSVEAWVNGASGQNANGSAIVAKGYNGTDEFVLDASAPNGKFRFYIREANGSNPTIFASVGPDGNWHHLVGVCDEANNAMYLYVDGTINGAITGINKLGLYESTIPVSIGAQYNSGDYSYQFSGTIDDVSLYNYAMTSAQVQAHYTAAPEPPYFTAEPPATIVGTIGEKVILSSDVLGSMPLTNQWYENGTPIPNQTNLFLTLTNLPDGTNVYVLMVSNAYGFTNTGGTTVQVAAGSGPPVLIADIQSLSNSVYQGEPFTFSVTASGQSPLAYQWWFGSQAIPGATNSSYTIESAASTNAGNYYCAITNSISGIDSSTAALVVVPLPTNPYALTILADGPVAYYRLDETNGSTIGYDYVGGYNGIYSNTANIFHVPGCFGTFYDGDTAAYFATNNTSNTFLGASISNLDFSVPNGQNGAFSVEAWAKGPVGTNQRSGAGIVAKGVGNGDEQFSLDASSGFRFFVRNALSGTSIAAAQAASTVGGSLVGGNWQLDGKWHHLVGVCDQANNNVLLYVDGTLIGPNIITNGVVPPQAIALDMNHPGSTGTNGEIYTLQGIHEPADVGPTWWYANSVSIGSRNWNSASPGITLDFIGAVDEVAFYDYALSPLQVANHFAVAVNSPVTLTATLSNGRTILTWSPAGATATLQSSTNLTGPWTTVPGATSPYTTPTSSPVNFYRVKLF